jgi:multiple sugar transport system ATP-binding protein
MTVITVQHVSKQFTQVVEGEARRVVALDNVSLKITSGDVLAVLGPSGCGKSTLLRCVAGLEQPDSGAILYDNVDLREIDPKDRGIGMVFQDGALMPHWEAERTVGFFLWLRHRQQEVPARVARISQITGIGLEKLMDRKPSQLSGGERQRVAVARALTRDPRVFLFDEPFSSLDAKLRGQARIELRRLLNEFPVTSIYVTHDQQEAITLAHRIAIMREGMIEQIGTYRHLYDNPHNLFVATFIGVPTINLFEGVVYNHTWQGDHFGGLRVRGDLPDGTRVTVGVRPETFRLSDDGAPARVDTVTPFYAEKHVLLEVRAGGERWRMHAPPELRLKPGDTVRAAFNPDDALCFDTKTGLRIG